MRDAPDQEMLDVELAGDGKLQVGLGFPPSSPAIGKLGTCDTAANQEAPVKEVGMAEHQPLAGLSYTIDDQRSSFTEFIKDLRVILADHQDCEDICDRHVDPNISSSRKHPLLPMPRAEQPARWIHIKLQVVEGEESSSSATLLMRDDNMDVIGFINQSGVCYDFADPKRSTGRMLPQEYKSVLLGWGNSYKSILGVRKKEEVMDILMSANLGKTFATHAVRLLSHFGQDVVADVYNHKLALAGLMFMVSESAKMNPVHDAIASGWDTGTGFTKQLMTDYVSKYVEMSRRLRHWKRRDYAERRPDPELHGIYLVLNVHAELVYTIGDEISFISFMTELRRKLADHPDKEDILGGHKDPNLSQTGNHPVLAKQRADEQPARWILVTLQAMEGEETSWTTLFMRDDNLYVLGFMNQQGDSFQLLDKNRNASTNMLLPITNGCDPQLLRWGVSYMSMLEAKSNDHAVHKLEEAHLGCDFAKNAVRVLSSHPNQVIGVYLRPGVALAGLIVMICESARMNPPHNSLARGWSTGMGFAKQLMKDYVWEHGEMSRKLRTWKNGGYATKNDWQPHPIMELLSVHLVLNTHTRDPATKEENKKSQHGKPGNTGNDGDSDSSSKPGSHGGGGSPPRQSKGGHNAGRGGHGCKWDYNNDTNGGPQSQHRKACNVGSTGSPASKSEEAAVADSGGERDGKSEEARDADSGGGPASQADEAGDNTSSSGGDSSSQPGEAGDGDSRGGSARQPGEAGDNSPSQGNSGSQNGDLDLRCQGHGRPRVELLAINADLQVKGTEIIVFDGRRGQIIYRKEEGEQVEKKEQREQEMVKLVLIGPYKGISAYGCFAIKIDIPPAPASSSSGDAGGVIKWEWDCYDPKYAEEVDKPPVSRTISSSGPGRNVKVTYAVMSNALEATVHVMLRLKGGHIPSGAVNGKITARVSGFKYSSVLFSRTHGMDQCLCPSNDSRFLLELARNVVAVPCGRVLHIVMDLQIETSTNQGVKLCLRANLDFANGITSQRHEDKDGNEVEVNIDWYPESAARPSEFVGDAPPGPSHHSMETEMVAARPSEYVGDAPPGPSRHSTVSSSFSKKRRWTTELLAEASGPGHIAVDITWCPKTARPRLDCGFPWGSRREGLNIEETVDRAAATDEADKDCFFTALEAGAGCSSPKQTMKKRTFSPSLQRMAEAAPTAGSGIGDILATGERDFLVRNSGEQVKISSIEASPVAIYFSASWCPPCWMFTPKLIEVYKELASQGKSFEVVFASADRNEEAFNEYFAKMPWLAVPFSDTEGRAALDGRFKVSGIPHLVILDAKTGEVYTEDGDEFVSEYGVEAYPFTPDRINELKEQEKAEKENQTIQSVLGTTTRDYLISNKGDKVPISELEGKYVGLCFVVDGYGPVIEFTNLLAKIYEKLKEVGEKFEVVAVSLDSEESAFNENFAKMPWLAIPQGDQKCEKLVRYFELRSLPTLVLIGPDGKTLNSNVADIIDDHGFEAWEGFPFSAEKLEILAEKAKAKAASQTLESLLISGDLDFVIGKDGAKVPVSELVGKTVLLYFSAKWCGPCRAFLPTLVKEYNTIKEKNSDFEIVFISSDRNQSSFDDFFSEMPWLALPLEDERKTSLKKTFKIRGIPSLVAIGPTGQTVSRDAKAQLMIHGADAFPFTEERLEELQKKLDEMAKGWPQKLKHELHDEHELVLLRRGTYGCDACEEMGSTWSYRCDECDFDLHPKCALGEEKKGEEEEGKSTEQAPAGYVCEGGVCRKA